MARPTITVNAYFGDAWTAPTTATDISAYVRGFSIRRGRSGVDSQIGAGTATILLDNNDSRFCAWNTSSPYTPNVLPMVTIEIKANYATVDYDVFTGYAEAWPAQWSQTDGTVQLDVVDGFKLLGFHETAVAQVEELSGTRVANYLDEASWPSTAGWRSLDAGNTTVIAHQPNCEAVLGLCQKTAEAEDGLFFINPSGEATFQDSSHRSGAAIAATYGDDGAELRYVDLVLEDDDRNIWNEITVQAPDGSSATVSDATSITSYGKRTLKQFDVHVRDATDATTLGNALLAKYKDPYTRVVSMRVDPDADATNLYPRILSDDISTKLTVKRRAPSASVFSSNVFIEGYQLNVSPARWRMNYNLSTYA